MIQLHDVDLTIGDRMLLQGVNATVERGAFISLLGPNGVGKTTLLRAICGLLPVAGGEVTVDGRSVHELASAERARHLAFVTSDDALIDGLRVRDVVESGRYAHHRWWEWSATQRDERAVNDALELVGMTAYADRLLSTLSSGERQRVWIATGLAQDAPALILDEPTSHLDVRVAHEILALLREVARSGKSVVCVLHDLNDAAAYSDRLMLLGCGTLLAFDAPETVLASDRIESAYGIAMERLRTDDGRLRVIARDVRQQRT